MYIDTRTYEQKEKQNPIEGDHVSFVLNIAKSFFILTLLIVKLIHNILEKQIIKTMEDFKFDKKNIVCSQFSVRFHLFLFR